MVMPTLLLADEGVTDEGTPLLLLLVLLLHTMLSPQLSLTVQPPPTCLPVAQNGASFL